jgi:LEA14-like dessication related protein
VWRHSRIAEIQLSEAHGTIETSERSSGMETICGTQTISEMETTCGTQTIAEMEIIICVVTGKNTFSLTVQGIGIAIGTAIATIGGMVTNAPSLMERG